MPNRQPTKEDIAEAERQIHAVLEDPLNTEKLQQLRSWAEVPGNAISPMTASIDHDEIDYCIIASMPLTAIQIVAPTPERALTLICEVTGYMRENPRLTPMQNETALALINDLMLEGYRIIVNEASGEPAHQMPHCILQQLKETEETEQNTLLIFRSADEIQCVQIEYNPQDNDEPREMDIYTTDNAPENIIRLVDALRAKLRSQLP